MTLCFFIGAVIGLHELDDCLVIVFLPVRILTLHSIESEYIYPRCNNRYIEYFEFEGEAKKTIFMDC